MTDIVEDTWKKLGYQIRAHGYRVWVRCDPHERKTRGGLWLPPKQQAFHGTLPHLVTMHATVLSSGPVGVAAQFQPGDRICFKRLHFGWWAKLDQPDWKAALGESMVGFIDANDVIGFQEEAA